MMTYIIIAVILLVVIVPIFSVLPTKRQKEQMVMRQAARVAGVQVELTSIEDPNPRQEKYVSHIGQQIDPILKVIAWRIPRRRESNWRQLEPVNWCLQRELDRTWRFASWPVESMNDELVRFLEDSLVNVPSDVEQIEEDDYLITVYWHEENKATDQQVIEFLKKCAELPLRAPVINEDEE